MRRGFLVCTCLSALTLCTCLFALSLCTSLFALHLVLTPHSTFLVYFLRTSLRRMSFEMIGFGDTASSADLSFGIFFYLHNTYLQVRYVFYNFSLIAKLCRRILKAFIRPWGFMLRFMIVVRMICYVILRLVCLTPHFL